MIDIDLILHGATRMQTPSLTLPHPRAHEREFVMRPLREIAPHLAERRRPAGVPL
jgi:2-amino-4-hydroxy-6-hydroxymethyldihydropteridine diphosphokinase